MSRLLHDHNEDIFPMDSYGYQEFNPQIYYTSEQKVPDKSHFTRYTYSF